jgi:hypothetical protein
MDLANPKKLNSPLIPMRNLPLKGILIRIFAPASALRGYSATDEVEMAFHARSWPMCHDARASLSIMPTPDRAVTRPDLEETGHRRAPIHSAEKNILATLP